MIAALLLALAAAADATDPCAPVEPRAEPDAASAAAYLAVGEAEQARGALPLATAAAREALALDPLSAPARALLAALCTAAGSEQRLLEGVRLLKLGDRRGAAAAFAQARQGAIGAAAQLLEGIARYELGEDEAARARLLEAAKDPQLADEAGLFLGLIALRTGEADEAARRFEAAARSREPSLQGPAASLLRLARRGGRLSITGVASAGFDSNTDLAPDGAPTAGGSGDGAGVAGLSALLRPTGETGFYARAAGSYRKLLRFPAFDAGSVQGAVGGQLGAEQRHLRAEVGLDYVALGGISYLSAQRIAGDARYAISDVGLSAVYAARFESFLTSVASGYSGLRQSAELAADLRAGPGTFGVGWLLTRDRTDVREFAFLEHGPRAFARLPVTPRLRLGLDASFVLRGYDIVDAALGIAREDRYLDAAAIGELDLTDRLAVRGALGVRRAASNVASFVYTQVTGSLGLAFSAGLF